jgi:ankyrin repeat protein
MIQPPEMKLDLPMKLSNGVLSTTTKVWDILMASFEGDLARVQMHVADCPELAYAQYNYAPPINFAVREGHAELVRYLLSISAHDPEYRFYPFQESMQTVAADRGFDEIVTMLNEYETGSDQKKFRGDNGEIHYNRSDLELEFQQAADILDKPKVEAILKDHPEFALDRTYFWGEGILLFAAKENNHEMIDLLMSYGATVPKVLKWTQFYYFERLDAATYLMEKGMDPNTMSYQHVTILHDMAQKGFIDKASLLLEHGAEIDPIDEAYQSTPLGLAARWGHVEMVEFLLSKGADPKKSGAEWSTPRAWAVDKGHHQVLRVLSKASS